MTGPNDDNDNDNDDDEGVLRGIEAVWGPVTEMLSSTINVLQQSPADNRPEMLKLRLLCVSAATRWVDTMLRMRGEFDVEHDAGDDEDVPALHHRLDDYQGATDRRIGELAQQVEQLDAVSRRVSWLEQEVEKSIAAKLAVPK